MSWSRHEDQTAKQKANAEQWGLAQREKLFRKFDDIGRFTFSLIDVIGVDDRKTVRSPQGNLSDVIVSKQLSYVNPDTQRAYGIQLGITSMHQLIRFPHWPPHAFLGVAAILSAESGTSQTLNLKLGEFAGAFTIHHPTLPYYYQGNPDGYIKLERFTRVVGLVQQLVAGEPPLEVLGEPNRPQPISTNIPAGGIDMYL